MKKKTNFREFIPIGISLLIGGVVFITLVSQQVGIALTGLGVIYLAIGIKKTYKQR